MKNFSEKTIASIIFSCAFIIGLIFLSGSISKLRETQRTVNVRGLSEREVDADLAIWPMTFSLGSNDLSTLQKEILSKTEILRDYLHTNGLTETDYKIQSPVISDSTTNMYVDKERITWKYIAKVVIMIRSSNIASVQNAQTNSINLLDKGIAITRDYDSNIEYMYTGLNTIKPEMIADATKNARLAAEQFARDSGSKVGKIKNASQGLFSIEDAATGLSEKKSVRVVTTIEYILVD